MKQKRLTSSTEASTKLDVLRRRATQGVKEDLEAPLTEEDRVFKTEIILASWHVLIPIGIIAFLLTLFGVNYIFNMVLHIGDFIHGNVHHLQYLFRFYHPWIVLIDLLFAVLVSLRLVYKLRVNNMDHNTGQKGKERWTTIQEIEEQYKSIPEKGEFYNGGGGVPVSRYKDKIFIDDSPVNNLIIGITRSGKGEMFVFPMIDIYSRAGKDNPKKRASLVVADPKLELYANSFTTLQQRGYDVRCLNLVEPIKSMGYNPLQLIIEAYKQENFDDAEMLANTFAYSIFNPGETAGNEKFWQTSSANLLVALILAHIEDCLKEDQHENVVRLRVFREKQKNWDNISDEKKIEIKKFMADALKEAEAGRKDLNKRAQEQIQAKANDHSVKITISMDAGEQFYQERVRRLYQYEIYDFDAIDPNVEYYPTDKYERQITMYSIVNTFTELARLNGTQELGNAGESALDNYFADRPVGDRGKLKYASVEVAGDQTKGSIFASCLAELTIFTYNDIAKMTAHTEFDLDQVGFGDKPQAIFLGIPDYDQSNHFIATVFIRQLYFVLAKTATIREEAKGGDGQKGKCDREVIFLLDEFGNLPAIEGMDSIITVCLGRNIRFDLIIQSYAQIEQKYDKGADTIIGNCGNQIYIQTNDEQTAKNFSSLLGSKTIKTISRSGQKLSIDKSFTESYEERPLLNANELMDFQQGQCAVVRVMKRTDLNYNNITPYPIYNHGDTAFKFRYEYLADDFPNDLNVDDIAYDKTVKNTRMENITLDIYHFFSDLIAEFLDDDEKGEDSRFQLQVDIANGQEYADRHNPANMRLTQLSNISHDELVNVHKIMEPYLLETRLELDPTFAKYTFEDCLWKTFSAMTRNDITPAEFVDKFEALEEIFAKYDSSNIKMIQQNIELVRKFLASNGIPEDALGKGIPLNA